jgi:hypothetical protein
MKQEQEQQSALDYFWKQIGNKLDSYQKDLFSQFYEKAKVIEQEKLVGEAKEFAQWIDNNNWICDPFPRKEFNDNLLRYSNIATIDIHSDDKIQLLTIDELYELFKKAKSNT